MLVFPCRLFALAMLSCFFVSLSRLNWATKSSSEVGAGLFCRYFCDLPVVDFSVEVLMAFTGFEALLWCFFWLLAGGVTNLVSRAGSSIFFSSKVTGTYFSVFSYFLGFIFWTAWEEGREDFFDEILFSDETLSSLLSYAGSIACFKSRFLAFVYFSVDLFGSGEDGFSFLKTLSIYFFISTKSFDTSLGRSLSFPDSTTLDILANCAFIVSNSS